MRQKRTALTAVALLTAAAPAHATLSVFEGDLAGFNAAAGNPPITIDFESQSGQNLAGQTVAGVTFLSPAGNSLDVVPAASTVSLIGGPTHSLPATSGTQILSPGGATLPGGPTLAESDGLRIDFASPVSAFGLDILFESLDGFSLFGYTIYDAPNGNVIATNPFIAIPGTCCSGSYFLGFVSNAPSTNIGSIVFNEDDSNDVNPDANVGYDTFRFAAPTGGVPEPATWASSLLGFGILGAAMRFYRRKGILRAA